MSLRYVAYVSPGKLFYSLPSDDREAAIAACFEAFPKAKTVTSCRFHAGMVTGGDMRWHDRYYWKREG